MSEQFSDEKGRRYRRHPADVTADRLVDEYEVYYPWLSEIEKDSFGVVINALREVAGGERVAGRQ